MQMGDRERVAAALDAFLARSGYATERASDGASALQILDAHTEVVLLDHDDFHWTLLTEDDHTHVVQLARAKDLVGELLVFPAEIAYVQAEPGDTDGEWLFECIVESEKAREVAYHFVMAHEYDDGEHRREEKWTH